MGMDEFPLMGTGPLPPRWAREEDSVGKPPDQRARFSAHPFRGNRPAMGKTRFLVCGFERDLAILDAGLRAAAPGQVMLCSESNFARQVRSWANARGIEVLDKPVGPGRRAIAAGPDVVLVFGNGNNRCAAIVRHAEAAGIQVMQVDRS